MKKKAIFIFVFLLIVGSIASSVYFFMKYKGAVAELGKKSGDPKQEVIAILDKVGKLIDLPTDEEPTVATVTDKEKLKEQKFFSKAENDDKVIIFVKSQKAILYRPAWNKVIEVARVDSIDQKQAGVEPSPVLTPIPVDVVVVNGTAQSGLSSTFVEKVKAVSGVNVTKKLNGSNKERVENLIVDLEGGKNTSLAQKLVNVLGSGTIVTQMPEGEATPSSQIVVFLGSSFTK